MPLNELKNLFSSRRLKVIIISLIIVCTYLIWNSVTPSQANPLTDQDRTEIIDSVATIFVDRYVYPEMGVQMDSMLKSNLANGVYNNDGLLSDFTQSISDDLREFSNDLHIWISSIPENRFYVVKGQKITEEQICKKSRKFRMEENGMASRCNWLYQSG